MLTMTYEYKLQPTSEQIAIIEQTLDVCRLVWNFALRQRKDWCNSSDTVDELNKREFIRESFSRINSLIISFVVHHHNQHPIKLESEYQ